MPNSPDLEDLLFQVMEYLRPRHFSLAISPAQLAVLRWLYRYGPISVSEAAQRARVSQSAMTQTTHRLEREGLVQRQRDQHDQRVVWVSVTETGQQHVVQFETMQRARLRTWVSTLSPNDQDHLSRILQQLVSAIPPLTTHSKNTSGINPHFRP